ncbi:MAG: hypothetical protein U9Q66_02675, partial [Patescibacteria group bacterium]|nr:hypothetical protein [Patescibacteria group bacterium]
MINKLILAWRNPESRQWIPIGNLEYKNEMYYFNYTNGVKDNTFQAFGKMDDFRKTYSSKSLFPIFKNRLLAKSRPEYEDFLNWLDINNNDNELIELSRSRGIRATDNLQLFPIPEKDKNGNYEVLFFSHGISHIAEHYVKRLSELNDNDKLLILKDVQNEVDPFALALRTKDDPVELLGYCPSFFVKDFYKLMEINGNNNV